MILRLLNTGLAHPRPYRRRLWLEPLRLVDLATCQMFIYRHRQLREWVLCVRYPDDSRYDFRILASTLIRLQRSGLQIVPRAEELGGPNGLTGYPLRWLLEFQAPPTWPADWTSLPEDRHA